MNFLRLKERFVHVVLGRPVLRHFRRLPILDLRSAHGAEHALSAGMARHLADASLAEPAVLLAQLHSQPRGLSEAAAAAIRAVSGANEVEHEKPRPWWLHLWHCYVEPFNLLLTILAVISFFTEDIKATIVISIMVLLSTLIRFFQETKSSKAADQLKAMVSNTATVLRCDVVIQSDGAASQDSQLSASRSVELPIKQLVPGDIVLLSAGDMIPADLRVLQAKDLFVSQSAMTGESLPVEKFVEQRQRDVINPLDLDNICFMGTNVVSGSATAVVVSTGQRTYFGDLVNGGEIITGQNLR